MQCKAFLATESTMQSNAKQCKAMQSNAKQCEGIPYFGVTAGSGFWHFPFAAER